MSHFVIGESFSSNEIHDILQKVEPDERDAINWFLFGKHLPNWESLPTLARDEELQQVRLLFLSSLFSFLSFLFLIFFLQWLLSANAAPVLFSAFQAAFEVAPLQAVFRLLASQPSQLTFFLLNLFKNDILYATKKRHECTSQRFHANLSPYFPYSVNESDCLLYC